MQIGGMSSLFTLKTKSKKTLYSNYSFVFFVILSITLITFDVKNIVNPSIVRTNIINSIFFTKDFFSFNLPNLDKLKLSFISKEELILENKYLKETIKQNNLFKLKSKKLEIENNILRKELSLLPPILENYVFVKVTTDTQTHYNKTVIKKFGIEFPNFLDLDGYTVATRSVFIIDEQGIIRYKWLADNPGQEPNYEEIDSQLASMN